MDPWRGEIIACVALIVLILVARIVTSSAIKRSSLNSDQRRKWLVQVRSGAMLILVFGLSVIWAEELRTFALSLMAIAVAVTIATKELLLCLTGAVVRTSSRSFAIGDRIRIGDFRGDVIDIGALSTKLLELDELTHRRTGRTISLPNSMLLDNPVLNETLGGTYVLSLVSVPISDRSKWKDIEKRLLDAANSTCAPFLAEAKRQFLELSKKEGLDAPFVEPTVNVILAKTDETKLVLRFPTPVRHNSRTSQAILRKFLATEPSGGAPLSDSVEQSLEP